MKTIQAVAFVSNSEVSVDSVWDFGDLRGRFRGIRFPESGRTFLYGHSEGTGDHIRRRMATQGQSLQAREVFFPVVWHRSKMTSATMKEVNFFNAGRAADDLKQRLQLFWQKRIGGSPLFLDNFPGETAFPYIFDELIKEPDFAHLDAIAYSVATHEIGRVYVVTVFNKAAISLNQSGGV